MATTDKVTLTDGQLFDMRHLVEEFGGLRDDVEITVLSADVQIEGDRVVHVRYDKDAGEFVVEL